MIICHSHSILLLQIFYSFKCFWAVALSILFHLESILCAFSVVLAPRWASLWSLRCRRSQEVVLKGIASWPMLVEQLWFVQWRPNLLSSVFWSHGAFPGDQASEKPYLGWLDFVLVTTLSRLKCLTLPGQAHSSMLRTFCCWLHLVSQKLSVAHSPSAAGMMRTCFINFVYILSSCHWSFLLSLQACSPARPVQLRVQLSSDYFCSIDSSLCL